MTGITAGRSLTAPPVERVGRAILEALGGDGMCMFEYRLAGEDPVEARLAHRWGTEDAVGVPSLEAAAVRCGQRLRAEGIVSDMDAGANVAMAPVFAGDSFWGCLTMGFGRGRSFSKAQGDALRAAAEIIGAAIHHRQSLDDLRIARKRLELGFDSSPVATFSCDPRRGFATTWVSENVETLFGIPARWLLGQPLTCWDAIHPDDHAALAACAHGLSCERPGSGLFRYRGPRGEIRWLRVEMKLIAGASGEPAEVIGWLVDSTETMQALEDLQQREAVLSAVSFVAERFLYGEQWEQAIPAALERLGKAARADQVLLIERMESSSGHRIKLRHAWTARGNDCSNATFPSGPKTAPVRGIRVWEEALDRGEVVAGCVSSMPSPERLLLQAEGVQSIAIIPIFVGAARWGQIGFSRGLDVAWPSATLDGLRVAAGIIGAAIQNCRAQEDLERRVAERTEELALANRALQESGQLYRTLVETSPDGILVSSPDHRITMVNPRARALFRWEGPEDPVGALEPELLNGGNLHAAGRTLTRRDGTSFQAEVSSSVVRDAASNPRYVIRIVRDITERIQLEDQFRQAQKMEAIGRLAGGIAHDFNNLLTVMKGYGELLLKRLNSDPGNSRKVAQIVKAAERAAALVEQLLAFSRKQMVEPKVIEVNAAMEEMEKMLRRLIGEDIEFATRLDAEAGRVRVDPAQLDQLIMNLTVNARDAMQAGGSLTISTGGMRLEAGAEPPCPGMPAGRFACIEVRDTGTGMSEEVRRHIFEPFFTTKEVGKGTGLGLSTVYGIVQQTGGFIDVETAPGAGSAFRIYLPNVNGNGSSAAAAMQEAGGGAGRETILVAEDEDAVRAMIAETLEECGYTVIQARNGKEALHVAAQLGGPIQMLLTDVVMPQMGGPELWKILAPRFPGVRLLYITGYADRELDAGAPFLKKPFSPDALSRRVRQTLDGA